MFTFAKIRRWQQQSLCWRSNPDSKAWHSGLPRWFNLTRITCCQRWLSKQSPKCDPTRCRCPKNAIAVAANIESGSIVLGTAFPGDPSKSPEDQPNSSSPRSEKVEAPTAEEEEEPDKEGDGDEAGAVWLDFRELLDLPWRPAQLALRVIAFDEVSNPVFVTLQRDATMGVEFFPSDVAAEIVRRNKAAVDRGQGLPQFTRSRETPRLDSIGIALTLGKVRTRAGEPVPVHSALRMELSFESIVKHSKDSGAKKVDAQSTLPAAVVKAALLVTIRNRNRPARIDVDIPIWSDKTLRQAPW